MVGRNCYNHLMITAFSKLDYTLR